MNKSEIKRYKEPMQYRRFGKTEEYVSVITLGGMRYKHNWEEPAHEIPEAMLKNAAEITEMALDAGINLIETAHNYVKSETCYGMVLNDLLKVPRESYYLMTKGFPMDRKEARSMVKRQLKTLKTDYFDFYAWHGLNNMELFDQVCCKGGAVEELLKMKRAGIIRHLGFSTHGRPDVIMKAIESGLFDFVNLHYYYFNQRNRCAVDLAGAKDMGVFIISPNDKGGRLFNPPALLKSITAPITPMQWNARFCLSTPQVHTLSYGMREPGHIKDMLKTFPVTIPLNRIDRDSLNRLDMRVKNDPVSAYEGYELEDDPSGIDIPSLLRYRRMWKCYHMKDYGLYRYNMHNDNDHWLPGKMAFPENIELIDCSKVPPEIDIKALLSEMHEALYIPKEEFDEIKLF